VKTDDSCTEFKWSGNSCKIVLRIYLLCMAWRTEDDTFWRKERGREGGREGRKEGRKVFVVFVHQTFCFIPSAYRFKQVEGIL
jgi:hypothetical protein